MGPIRRSAARLAGAGLLLAAASASAWGPSGQPVQDIPIVSGTEMLRALAEVHPPAAAELARHLPGREPPEWGIDHGERASPGLPTAATAELVLRGVADPTAEALSLKALPEGAQAVGTQWHGTWTGAGDLEVTFVSRFIGRSGAETGTAFPAVTVRLSHGEPPLLADWRLARPADEAEPAPQGVPAPVPGQVAVRLPDRLEPLSAIKAYSQAMVRQDVDTMVALMHPLRLQRLGGLEAARAELRQTLDRQRRLHAWPIAEQINDIRALPAGGLHLYIVQSTRWRDGWPKPRGTSFVYLLDTPDGGRHWEVLDLPAPDRRWLHAIAPDFKDDTRVADLLPP